AWASLRAINAYTGRIVFGSPPVAVDGDILGLTFLGSLLVALLIGLLPVLQIWRTNSLQNAVQSGTRGASHGRGIRTMSSAVAVTQVALALILVIGAGLLVRSFAKLMQTHAGFDAEKIIHARVAVDWSYDTTAGIQAMQSRLLENIRAIPGVESVAYSQSMPG